MYDCKGKSIMVIFFHIFIKMKNIVYLMTKCQSIGKEKKLEKSRHAWRHGVCGGRGGEDSRPLVRQETSPLLHIYAYTTWLDATNTLSVGLSSRQSKSNFSLGFDRPTLNAFQISKNEDPLKSKHFGQSLKILKKSYDDY